MCRNLILTDRGAGSAIDGLADRFRGNHACTDLGIRVLNQLTRDDITTSILRLRLLRFRARGSLCLACVSALRATTLHAALLARSRARLLTRVGTRVLAITAFAHPLAERLRLLLGHVRECLCFRQQLFGHLEFGERLGHL